MNAILNEGEMEWRQSAQHLTDARKPIVVLEEHDPGKFEEKCEGLVGLGYKLSSSSCGFLDSKAYDFCGSFQAIFVLPEESV